MKSLGPKDISPEWNEATEALEPLFREVGASLWAIWYLNNEHDINVVDIYQRECLESQNKIEADDRLKDFVDNTHA
jgi:hypothetical protein